MRLIGRRTGDLAYFSPEAVAVAKAMMAYRLNPERAALRQVLALAVRVLGIIRRPGSGTTLPGA